jgi:ABC-type nitrate/sulfonate/bicarbonate transport system substrate-binding protein
MTGNEVNGNEKSGSEANGKEEPVRSAGTIGTRATEPPKVGLEQTELRLGFVALSDCAPLVIAKERGFFRRHGLSVSLERQPSWANIRDKVAHGLLDGAQMLAPMPLSSTLGLEGLTRPIIAPLALSSSGNAITVSGDLYDRMRETVAAATDEPFDAGRALRRVIRAGQAVGDPPLRLAVVHAYSSHHYQLAYWLAASDIDPERDVLLSVIPPISMVRALQRGEIDGYAVGEPWNQLALDLGIGAPVITCHEIWQSAPEKVFGVTEEWAEQHPSTLRALLRALLEASEWLDRPENRLEAVHVIAGESYVDAPVSTVARSMTRSVRAEGRRDEAGTKHVFHAGAATFPWASHAVWFLTQMLRWGQIEKPLRIDDLARRVYRADLYRDAAEDLGIAFPESDMKVEGTHDASWSLSRASAAITMGSDRFIDGRVFRPDEPIGYLESFEVSAMRVRLDDLALMNSQRRREAAQGSGETDEKRGSAVER